MSVQKVEHYACPKCDNRAFIVTVRTSYKDVLPLKGEEVPESASMHFTCSKCGRTFLHSKLVNVGTYDPAQRLEDALAKR